MIKLSIAVLCILFLFPAKAQESSEGQSDSVRTLNEIVVQAYEYDRPLREVPASIGVVSTKEFERFNNTSFLPAINTIPGVRMEERSPGSYRLSIRGSTLRSPFGVRNVKVYWNDLPFTDPGGNTYLNLLDFNSVQRAEVIKGPGASLYGAGTGGVLLLKSQGTNSQQGQLQFSTTVGSFGLWRYNVGAQNNSEKFNTTVQYAHQQSEGYREQTQMSRDVLHAQGTFRVDNKRIVSGNILYSDLFYQTPGALNQLQFDTLPKQARPAGGPNPGAVEQKAAVYNKTFYAALLQEYEWNSHWSNRTGVYGTFTQFENPTIRNYERRTEQSFGGRTVTQYTREKFKLNFGGEFQHGFSPVKTYGNDQGVTTALQTDDEITSTSALLFAQGEWTLPHDFFLTAGGSYNFYAIGFTRLSSIPPTNEDRKFTPVFSPRIALLKKITTAISLYGSVSKGFSPPTVAELYPSTAVFDKTLNPEQGNNYEFGVRGNIFKNTLAFDITVYTFQLKETIVSRKDTTKAGDPEYFVNAGNTSQKGLEINLSWNPKLNQNSFLTDLRLWTSFTLNDYRFENYSKDTISYSGNKLTGVAPNILVLGFDLFTRVGLYANITLNYTDRIPLNDANTTFANDYKLLGGRIGYRFVVSKIFPLDIFGGVDNAFDQHYSLGNDLNAAGGRYFNAAPTINFFAGIKGSWIF